MKEQIGSGVFFAPSVGRRILRVQRRVADGPTARCCPTIPAQKVPDQKAVPDPKENQDKVAAKADEQNKKLSPWTFVISKWVLDSFFTDPEAFFEKPKKE